MRAMIARLLVLMPASLRSFVQRQHYKGLVARFDLDREPDLRMAIDLVSPGDCVIDVGANIGTWSMVLSKHVGPRGKVIAIEPFPTTFGILKSITASTENIVLYNVAMSDTEGTARMMMAYDSRGIRNHYLAAIHSGPGGTSVRKITLDLLAREHGLRPRFVKIDAEGHELFIIRGGLRTIEECRPALCIETDLNSPQSDGAQVRRLLEGLDYRVWVRDGSALRLKTSADTAVNYFFLPRHLRAA